MIFSILARNPIIYIPILSNKLVVEKEERDKAFQINKKQMKIDGGKRLKEILDSRKS